MFIGFMAWKFKFVYMVEMGGVELGLVNDKDKFEKDVKDTLENLEEPVVSAKLQENPKYSLRLVDKDDIDVDDNYVFAKVEEKIEKTYTTKPISSIIILKKMISFLQKFQPRKKEITY